MLACSPTSDAAGEHRTESDEGGPGRAGITSPDGKRTAPSAGALYPLELYAVTPAQVMHYLPDGHRAEIRAVPDLRPGLTAAAFGEPHAGAAPAIIVVAAVPGRTRRRYGARAEAFAQLEAQRRSRSRFHGHHIE